MTVASLHLVIQLFSLPLASRTLNRRMGLQRWGLSPSFFHWMKGSDCPEHKAGLLLPKSLSLEISKVLLKCMWERIASTTLDDCLMAG